MRTGQPYALRDGDGTLISELQERVIVRQRYSIASRRRDSIRQQRIRERRNQATGWQSQKLAKRSNNQPAKPIL